jgi:hypothetical protein
MHFKRLFYLIKNDLVMQSKTIMMTVIAVLLFFSVFSQYESIETYRFFLYFIGFMITAYAFSDVHDKQRGYQYLLLPARSFEKFFTRWFLTSIVYAFGFSLIILGGAYIYSMLVNTAYDIDLNALYNNIWQVNHRYFLLQPIVLLGAVYFKNRVLLKTGLVFTGFLVLLIAVAGLIFYLFYQHEFQTNTMPPMEFLINMLSTAGFCLRILIAPICFLLAYFRFKKYEF